MKILIGCEYSGKVRDAFIKKGHDAISCDILPTDAPGPHYKGDIRDILYDGWDMLIGFPPCTYLTNAANGFLNVQKYGAKALERRQKQKDAYEFFLLLWNAPIKKICLENPVGYINHLIPPTQTIHPYMFGDAKFKRTCLWLRQLAPLVHTKVDTLFETRTYANETPTLWLDKLGESKARAKLRSETFDGVAAAMANAWG